jgi:DnaJ-class molecular chaperone
MLNLKLIVEDKRRKYDQLGRAGLSNGHGNSGYSSNNGYSRFSEDFLNRTFHFHNPFDIFEQFMSHFGMDDDFGMFNYFYSQIEIYVYTNLTHLSLSTGFFRQMDTSCFSFW